MARRLPRWLRRTLVAIGSLCAILLVLTYISTDRFRAFGAAPTEATLARMKASPRFVGDHFENAEPTEVMVGSSLGSLRRFMFGKEMRVPTCPLPMAKDTRSRLAIKPESGLRITWLGHSTTLIELDSAVLLTDPVWSDRASPSRWVGPRRFHPPPIALADLPKIDAVVISHEHYDHLDMATVRALAKTGVRFLVPLGIGAHLAKWNVPPEQIIEHDWWESTVLPGGVRIVSTPARHFNGRGVPGRIGALWTSWSLVGPQHRVFFSGDTGLTESFREIAQREGPFDVALLEIGQHHPDWGQIHLGPVGALDAYAMLGAKTLLPIHWSTFALAYHGWSEPAETLVVEAARRGVSVLTPLLGEPIEPDAESMKKTTTAWWRALPPMSAQCP